MTIQFSSNDIYTQNYPLLGTVQETQISQEQLHKILKLSPILLLASNSHASI